MICHLHDMIVDLSSLGHNILSSPLRLWKVVVKQLVPALRTYRFRPCLAWMTMIYHRHRNEKVPIACSLTIFLVSPFRLQRVIVN